MLKRIFILILALCCAFSFICQPATATGAELVFGALEIGMAIAGAFGLTFASNSGYEAFGNNIHDAVIQTPGPAGSEWWNRSLAGNIVLTGMDALVKTAVWSCAKQAADMYVESETGSFTTDFTLSSYSLNSDGSISSSYDFRGRNFSFSHSFDVPIYCIEFAYYHNVTSSFPYRGVFGVAFVSSETFFCGSKSAEKDDGFYFYTTGSSQWLDDVRLRKNCVFFSSQDAYLSYLRSLTAMSSGVSSAGGATAAYPAYGYDGVNLPNIDLTQPGLIGADGNSTVADLIGQLQSGAITWEDYIGTVAPGQTATITLTDANGVTATYTLTNTGVGEKVETGTEPGDETIPVVIPPGSEIATNDIIELLKLIASTVTNFMNRVVALLQSIYDWGVELGTSIRTFFETVIEKIQAFYDAVVEWFAALKDAVIQLGIQIGEFIATGVETMVTTVETWLEKLLAGVQSLADVIALGFENVIAAVKAIPVAIAEALSSIKSIEDPLKHFALDLRKYFPFCVPFDMYDFFMCLNAAPEAPVIEWAIPLPGGAMYPMKIYLSAFDSVAQLLRRLELLLFCVGLAFKTRDLIKG